MARPRIQNGPVIPAENGPEPPRMAEKPARTVDLATETASISMLSRLTGLDRHTVKKRLVDGGIQVVNESGAESLYRLGEALPALFKGGKPMEEAKLRKTLAEAQKNEILVQEKSGQLLPLADVKSAMVEFFRAMDSRLVNTYPGRAAQRIRAAKNAKQVSEILHHDMRAILSELRNDFGGFLRRHTGSDSGS